ncbi:MAG: polyribonucleotide nucleotidyltransferase [Bacilli bacterium]|nr:polyribonucleotide nucleotidyltransferase [Erysipelotrichaceae bacterium]MDY4818839.1 polyribonucleotide nucleotidyltransferase [Bacilli bacterium]
MMKRTFELDFEGRKIVVEVGEIAKQTAAAVLVRYGETVVLSNVTMSNHTVDWDFFPLSVEYQERMYAAGKIPGSFLRRESRPSSHAILASRITDRTMRPLFPEGFRNEVQVVSQVMSVDYDCSPELAAMLGSSLAVSISDIPFNGPIAGVFVGRVDGKLVINPTVEQKKVSDIDLTVAGTADAINMVEAGAAEVSEEDMLDALMFGHEAVKKLVAFENEIIKEVGKPKREVQLKTIPEELRKEVTELVDAKLRAAVSTVDKLEREEKINAIEMETEALYAEKEYASEKEKAVTVQRVHNIQEDIVHQEVRRLITDEKIRPDGRKVDEIRPLDAQVDLLPRAHGSAMFTRGQTQVISVTTLGPLSDEQIIDDLTPVEKKRFMHHYNFPQWCVGQTGKIGVLARREIGHGALGERALSYVIPSQEDFPYTIRTVSEVVESNGSSSQASICAGCMSLMAAGVPIKGVVSGIAMGLISSGPLDGKHPYTILTDIQGLEDHFGDMDFKVAGTAKGITALQMDIKIAGVTREVLSEALAQAHKARAEIRAVMEKAIAEPRPDVAKYAPKLDKLTIDVDKIRDVIGTGGKVINEIIAQCDNVQIDIDDDGHVVIYHMNRDMINKAKQMIEDIVREARVGEVYEGEVTRVEDYGAFVKLFGNCEGLCHVSRLGWGFIDKASDVVKVGDVLKVRVCEIDEKGKVKVSHREFVEKPAGYVEKPVEKKPFKGHKK